MSQQVSLRPFDIMGATVQIIVGAASANVQVPVNAGARVLLLTNIGTNPTFVQLGKDNTVAATLASSIPILPNATLRVWLHNDSNWIAAIGSGAGSTLYITVGEGSQ